MGGVRYIFRLGPNAAVVRPSGCLSCLFLLLSTSVGVVVSMFLLYFGVDMLVHPAHYGALWHLLVLGGLFFIGMIALSAWSTNRNWKRTHHRP